MGSVHHSSERLEERRRERDFQIFLGFDFRPTAKKKGHRLAIVSEKIDGKVYEVLKKINLNQLSFSERLSLSYSGKLDIKRIGRFVENNLDCWHPEDEQEQMSLERQVAYLAKKLKGIECPFNNPYQKALEVIVRHYDGEILKEKITKIFYDRLTSKDQLLSQIKEITQEKISLNVPLRVKKGGDLSQCTVSAPPEDIFKQVVIEPEDLFDPISEPTSIKERKVTYTYQNPDKDVVNYLVHQHGNVLGVGNFSQGFTLALSGKDQEKLFGDLFMPDLKKELNKLPVPPRIYLDTSQMQPPTIPLPLGTRVLNWASVKPDNFFENGI